MGDLRRGAKLGIDARKTFAERVVESGGSDGLVIIHVGASGIDTVGQLAAHASKIGADAISAIVLFYYRYDKTSLVSFYQKIAEATDVPLLVYNNPPRQGYQMPVDTIAAVFEAVKGVKGVKDTSGDPEQLVELRLRFSNTHFIASGSDTLVYNTFVIGLPAHISGLACIYPELVAQIYRNVVDGRMEEALRLQSQLNKIRNVLKSIGPDVASYKHVLKLRGIDIGGPLPPTRPLTSDEEKQLEQRLPRVP
ncbi:MAG: dihydrodipicolinate synthase family protein [Aigarchaeota archaeon]|nr:dihydrodipicolinate synthase family protein [Candidatus Pelearchaeum maunauluense]